ncbi:reverse transcriptase domain-containing protein [Tanacetum coccineum]
MMTDKYYPRNEFKKLEMEIWDLKVNGTDLTSYTQHFQELTLLCGRMFLEESDKIEKYVGGLTNMIHGSVVASKPKTMQDAVEIATELMDKKIRTFGERQTESKRKAYTVRTGEKKQYGGSKPLCSKCNYHHDGPCAPKCHKCNKVSHFARDCRSTANANNANYQKGIGSGQKPTYYECGVQGHFKRECPKLKNNNNRGNQVGGANAPAKIISSATSQLPTHPYYTDSEPRRASGTDDEEPLAPPSPDYIPGPEDPQTPPVLQDEDELPAEEHHAPVDSPTASHPAYVLLNDGDDDDGDSSRDDADGDDEDNEEEKEHLAPTDSAIVVPVDEPVFPPEGTEPVIPPPSTNISIGARITIRPQTSISLPPKAEVERLLAMTTLSPSPPISLSPPSVGERLARCTALPAHPSPPPVPSPLLPSSGCPTQIQTLRIASTQALIEAVTAALPSPPLPPLPPSLYIPPPVDRRDDIPESEQPPRKRLYFSTLGSRYEVEESSIARPTRGRGIDYGFVSTVDAEERRQGIRDVGYGIRDTWVDPAEAVPEIAPMTVGEVNTRVTELAELHEHDTQDLYALLEDAQDSRSRISQRVDMDSQRVDLLMGDRMTLQETVWMVEEEAYASREAWAHSIGLSQATHQELQTHRDHVYAHETHLQAHQTQLQLQGTLIQTQHQVHETCFQMHQAELAALRETDRRRHAQMPGPEARIPDQQDASGDADSHIQ